MSDEVFFHPLYYGIGELVVDGQDYEEGWYYWYFQPGCLPESGPVGPFAYFAAASATAKEDEEKMRMQ